MKKLMIAAAIVCAAVVSQAATVSWGNSASSPLTDLTGAAITKNNYESYALAVSLVDADGTKVATVSTIGMTAGALTSTDLNWTYTFGTGEGQYNTGALFDIIATATFGGKQYEMTIVDNYALTAKDNGAIDTITWAEGNYGGGAGAVATWSESVPEPTSGLLLLLGMAGLALRRRRA